MRVNVALIRRVSQSLQGALPGLDEVLVMRNGTGAHGIAVAPNSKMEHSEVKGCRSPDGAIAALEVFKSVTRMRADDVVVNERCQKTTAQKRKVIL